jgi:hypothetical protein
MSIQRAFECESLVRQITTQQTINGVNFDEEKARGYISELEARKEDLYQRIRPNLQLEVVRKYGVPISKPFNKDGSYNHSVGKWYSDIIPSIGGGFSRVEFCEPNLGSRNKLIRQLLRVGWKPRNFTIKGNPQLTVEGEPCPSLMEIGDEIGQWIAHWYIYNHRQSQIQGWLNKLRHDGKLEARAITIGTPTYRFRHSIVVNVPKSAEDVLFGKEMRSLFIADEGDILVGHDASGLELRMLAHYMNDKDYIAELLSGDIHTANQKAAGLPTRDDAKTFIYAFNYGAGDKKIGSIIDGTARDGKRIKKQFLDSNPALKALIGDAKKRTGVRGAALRGYLIGLDGRKIYLRRDKVTRAVQVHKALNTLLQCAGALVMKYAMINLDTWIRELELGSKKVIDMHDECQYSVPPEDVEMHSILARYSIIEAGRQLNLRIPLDADAKVGVSWEETH